MRVLVSDTSILIDLDRGNLVELVFALPYEFAVPDVLYHREIKGEWGDRLLKLGLRVEEVSEEGVSNALRYRSSRRALSLPDTFACALAHEREWTLLTGDGQLRELAIAEDVDCHGLLWLLDRIEEESEMHLRRLYDGLHAIGGHPRCRLPRGEITIRLDRYRSRIENI